MRTKKKVENQIRPTGPECHSIEGEIKESTFVPQCEKMPSSNSDSMKRDCLSSNFHIKFIYGTSVVDQTVQREKFTIKFSKLNVLQHEQMNTFFY